MALKPLSGWYTFSLNALTHVMVLFLGLTLLFSYKIKDVEKRALQGEFVKTIDTSLLKALRKQNTKSGGLLKQRMQVMLPRLRKIRTMYTRPDAATDNYNNMLLLAAYGVVIVIAVAIIALVIAARLSCGYDAIKEYGIVFAENIFIFLLVLPIEFIFFIKIAAKFVPVKPSFMMRRMLQDVDAELD